MLKLLHKLTYYVIIQYTSSSVLFVHLFVQVNIFSKIFFSSFFQLYKAGRCLGHISARSAQDQRQAKISQLTS